MKTLLELQKEFGKRLITLNSGAHGIRAGITCNVTAAPEDNTLDFIASDETIDRYNESVSVAGWDLENFKANPVIPDCHDYSSIAKILGRATSVSVKNKQLINTVEFCVDNPMGNLAYKMAKGGFIKSQSVGFIPLEWKNGIGGNEPDRIYLKQELLEISLVVVPANPGATIGLALKSGALEKSDLTELQKFLKQFCSDQADTDPNASTSGTGINDVQLLRIARDLNQVLKRA